MRKKSHISLAKFLVENMQTPSMHKHWKAFYLGSILPDCKPSFLTQRHEFEGTFEMVREQIYALSTDADLICTNTRAYMRQLGEVVHYLADYFTFPHNESYDGNLKDHCSYENDLKFRLREYVASREAARERLRACRLETAEEIARFIQEAHAEYVSRKRSVEEDCEYIVRICYQVTRAILELLSTTLEMDMKKRLCLA